MDFLIAFMCGVLFHVFWSYVMNTGQAIILVKNTAIDCMLMLATNIKSVYELNTLKYESLELMERDSKYIEFQKKIDDKELKSLKNIVIRNFISSIPPKHNHIVKFHDWDTAMQYLKKAMKEKMDD